MKLLLDENLSYRMIPGISDLYPDYRHVSQTRLQRFDDESIWDFARQNDFIIVSKDSDFHQRSFLRGSPPKVIRLKTRNSTTDTIIKLARSQVENVQAFDADPSAAFLVIES